MKRFLSLILGVALILSIFSGCSFQHFSFDNGNLQDNETTPKEDVKNDEYITRIEWAEVLGGWFGMDTCLSDEPYFADVPSSNPAFAYVQSCVEWEVFSLTNSEFHPEEFATIEFVVSSAVMASEAIADDSADPLTFATNCGVVQGDTTAYATREYAAKTAEWAYSLYAKKEFVEYENIEFNEALVDLSELACGEDGVVVAPEGRTDLKVGDVIITAPTQTNPYGVARKVTSVSVGEGGETVITTVEPEIGEVYSELDFAYVGTITDPSTVQTAEGVTINGITPVSARNDDSPKVVTLGYRKDNHPSIQQLASKGTNLSFSVSLEKGGKLTFSPAYNSIKADIEKGDNSKALELFKKTGYAQLDDLKIAGDVQTVKATDKYTGGWKIEGSLALKNFYVETELKTKKALGVPYGIKSFEYEIHYEVVSSLKFSGKLEEEVAIATVPIPLGGTGVTIDVEIFAKASVNGDIEISASIANTSTVKYSEKNGYKKTQSSQCEKGIEISVNFKVGFGGKATLKALGIKLIDFKLDVGMGFEAAAKATKVMRSEDGIYKYDGGVAELGGFKEDVVVCIDGTAYFPTVSLSLGTSRGTLANKLGNKFTWKIMDKSGATFKSQLLTLHYEVGNGIVDECTIDTYEVITEEDVQEELEKDENENKDSVGSDIMDVSHYAVTLAPGEEFKLSVTTLPYGFTGYDVVWVSDDGSIVKVFDIGADEHTSCCKIKAVSAGVTSITINTSDGSHQLKCSVTVRDDNTVDYNPLG